MGQHMITKGLTLPIKGQPRQEIQAGNPVKRVAIIADDYSFMKAKMMVNEGDQVKRGQPLFEDRKNSGVLFTAPGAGVITGINRGERRRLTSVIVTLNDHEVNGSPSDEDLQPFTSYQSEDISKMSSENIRALLIESGMWTTLRVRPMSQVPAIDDKCDALFITAIDTNPLAADINLVLKGREDDFRDGLIALGKLTSGTMFVCQGPNTDLSQSIAEIGNAQLETFIGEHPAGLVGTHIHYLHPVNRKRTAWHIGYQDVISIGRLLKTGVLDVERVISFAGPGSVDSVVIQTRSGAEVAPLVVGRVAEAEYRLIDGSVFYGRNLSQNPDTEGFLGRYRQQVTAIPEGRERVLFGWLQPGGEKFSVTRAFFSSLMLGQYGGGRLFDFTTSTNGSHRAMVPIGVF